MKRLGVYIWILCLLILFTYCKTNKLHNKNGEFSVSATTKVYFSPGNLQWSATNGGSATTTHVVAGGGTAAGTWRFAPNQWDMISFANGNIDSSYTGWIDLFGWGTSGYNNKYPYMTSCKSADYGDGSDNSNIAGTNYDWGVYNAIYNPKTNTTDAPGTWRTLTKDEWVYLLKTRTTTSGIRYAFAEVHGLYGVIIVPDDWTSSIYALTYYEVNIINDTDWAKMEDVGCVFLPAANCRYGPSLYYHSRGCYWSATASQNNIPYSSVDAYYLDIIPNYEVGEYVRDGYFGMSVRLVKDVK